MKLRLNMQPIHSICSVNGTLKRNSSSIIKIQSMGGMKTWLNKMVTPKTEINHGDPKERDKWQLLTDSCKEGTEGPKNGTENCHRRARRRDGYPLGLGDLLPLSQEGCNPASVLAVSPGGVRENKPQSWLVVQIPNTGTLTLLSKPLHHPQSENMPA